MNRTWVVRVVPLPDEEGHPDFIGPFTRAEAEALMERLRAARRSFEAGQLVSEHDLPGLYLPD